MIPIETLPDSRPTPEEALMNTEPRTFLIDFGLALPSLPLCRIYCVGAGYYLGTSYRYGPCLLRVASEHASRSPLDATLDLAIERKTGIRVFFVRSWQDYEKAGFKPITEVVDE